MTDALTSTRPAAPPPAPARFGATAWLRWFWRQLTSMRVALLLLFLLALAAIPGSLFPQRGTDPAAVSRYLSTHEAIGPWMDRLSLFDVYAAPWFAAVYLLLCVSLAGCIVPRVITHARALRRPPPEAPARLDRLPEAVDGVSAAAPDDVLAAGAGWLRGHRWRVRTGDGWVAAEKGYLRETGNLIFHVALLGLLAAVAVGSLFGWRGSVVVVEGRAFSNTLTQYDSFRSGKLVDRSGLAPFTVGLDDFSASYQRGGQQNGAPRDYQATVTYQSNPDAPVEHAVVKVNDPLELDGAKVFLTGHGYAPHVIVRDSTGAVVFDDAVPFLPRDGNFTSSGVIKVPDTDPQLGFQGIFLPTAHVDPHTGPTSTFPAPDDPGLFLSAWKGDLGIDDGTPQSVFRLDTSHMTKIGIQSLAPGGTWTLPDGAGSITFAGYSEYANLSVAHDPGKYPALAAGILAIFGLLLSLFVSRRRVWLRADGDEPGRTLYSVAGLARGEQRGVADEVAALVAVVPERIDAERDSE